MRKKKILLCNDASFLATGFATYGYEVMTRLAKTEKFELAEFGSYGLPNDIRQSSLPWKYFGNLPLNEEEAELYNRTVANQFGEWRFDSLCAEFKPDIVWDIRDCQMMDFEQRSPARPYFYHSIMPTVDAIPLHEGWISTYMSADAVFSWTDWGLDVLKEVSNNKIKTVCSAPPGLHEEYQPSPNKAAHKQAMGLSPDTIFIGTVMRNQKRKLFPDLILSFADIVKNAPDNLKKNLNLYLHTAYPDVAGWELPKLITEAGITNRVWFTYMCTSCGNVFPNLYQGVKAVCKFCRETTAITPRTQYSPSNKVMSDIYNIFDLYVQYSNCEGFGLPQIEAAACGVPVFAVDYSAMSDILRKVRGTPIAVERYVRDITSHTYRALPNNFDFVKKALDFLRMPTTMRLRKGHEAAKAAEQFNWDKTAKIWEKHFDEVEISKDWELPARKHIPNTNVPSNLSDSEFVRWCIVHTLGRPDLANSYMAMYMTELLTHGSYGKQEINRKRIFDHFLNLCFVFNRFEEKRCTQK